MIDEDWNLSEEELSQITWDRFKTNIFAELHLAYLVAGSIDRDHLRLMNDEGLLKKDWIDEHLQILSEYWFGE